MKPRCIIISGPNGSGKTTFARDYLPGIAGVIYFVNADLVAGGLSPLRPEMAVMAAGKLVAVRRVRRGGHNVPKADVERRFKRGWINFRDVYRSLADTWAVYENSESTPKLLERGP